MLQVKIELDTEKILCEKKWSLRSMIETIDEIAKMAELDRQLFYQTKGDGKDIANLDLFLLHQLARYEWFTLNVKSWRFIDEINGESDLIADCKKRNIGVWDKN